MYNFHYAYFDGSTLFSSHRAISYTLDSLAKAHVAIARYYLTPTWLINWPWLIKDISWVFDERMMVHENNYS